MTEQELKEIEARANAAFRAPWTYANFEVQCGHLCDDADCSKCGGDDVFDVVRIESPEEYPDGQVVADVPGLEEFAESNGKFIAHAREDVPKLIAEVRRLRDMLGGAKINVHCPHCKALNLIVVAGGRVAQK